MELRAVSTHDASSLPLPSHMLSVGHELRAMPENRPQHTTVHEAATTQNTRISPKNYTKTVWAHIILCSLAIVGSVVTLILSVYGSIQYRAGPSFAGAFVGVQKMPYAWKGRKKKKFKLTITYRHFLPGLSTPSCSSFFSA